MDAVMLHHHARRAHQHVFGWTPDRSSRRVLYGVFGTIGVVGWYGFVAAYPMLSDRATPLLWAIAAGACLVGVVRVDSIGVWMTSGTAVLIASVWRVLTLLWFEITDSYPAGQQGTSLVAVAVTGWSLAAIGAVAVWSVWLRPDDEGR